VDVRTGEARQVSRGRVDVLAFDPDGRRLFTVSPGRGGPAVGRVWDAERWRALSRIDLGTGTYTGAAFGPGDRIMLTAAKAPVRIVDLRTGETPVEFSQHFEAPGSVRASQRGGFSPHGKDVVTAGVRQALVWSPKTGRRRLRLRGHAAPINDAAFSPDGRWIATGSEDRTIRIWDARSGRPIAALGNYGSEVAAVAFTPDSRRILTSGVHGTVRLYPCIPCAPLRELKALAKEHVTRRLNREERITFLGDTG
jgi:dipeptidyl aminopeptidase/acylaminoacyl peptidase